MKKKVWDITVKDNPNRVVMGENDEFYTTDTEAYLVFNLQDKDFQPQSAMLTLENRNDGSLKSEEVSVVGDNITWEMPERYIEHSGNWQAQLVYEQMKGDVPEKYTSGVMAFTVNSHIKDKKKPSLVEIENWEKFIHEGTELIETWEDMEDLRQANEAQRQENYQELLDTGVLQTNINTKLEALEEEYAPKLTEVTSQLAHKANQSYAEGVNARVDNLVIPISPENANLEVTDAHVSVERNKDFGSLTNRFESLEQVTKPYLENLIHNGDFSKGAEGWVETLGVEFDASGNTLKINSTGTHANPQTTYPLNYGLGRFFVSFKIKVTDPNKKIQNIQSYIGATSIGILGYEDGSWTEFSQMYNNVNMNRLSILWRTGSPENSVGTAVEIKDVVVVDLNAMGNGQQAYELPQMKELISQFPNKYFYGIASTGVITSVLVQLANKYKTEINIKEYGAVGDGITDDTLSIRAAFSEGKVKTIIVPKGTYKITGTIYIRSDTHVKFSPEAKFILGDNYNLDVIKWRNQTTYPYITTRGNSKNIVIENLKLTGNRNQFEAIQHYGLVIYQAKNVTLINCEIDYINYNYDIPTVSDIMGYCLHVFGSQDVKVIGGRYKYGGYECIGLEDAHNVLIFGVYSGTGWRTSLQLHRGCTSIKILNNFIEQDNEEIGSSALTLHGGEVAAGKPLDDILIDGNTIIAKVEPTKIRNGAITSIADGEHNVRIVNNKIISNNFGITIALGSGWDISNNDIVSDKNSIYVIGRDIRIANNKIKRTKSSTLDHCITITDTNSHDIRIENNEIDAPLTKGILSSVDIERLKIKGNTINSFGEPIVLYQTKISDLLIEGNDLNSSDSHGIAIDNSNSEELVEGGFSITNNIIRAFKNAIGLNTYVHRPIITGNSILSGENGVWLARGVDYALVTNNDLMGATTPTKIDSGENNLVSNNLE